MLFHTSYREAFHTAMAEQTYAVAHLQSIKLPMNIDTSGCYKLFYFLTGGKQFHIDSYVYDVQPGDLFVINPREWHYFSHIEQEDRQDRFVFFFYPDFLQSISSSQTDLRNCFLQTSFDAPCHRIPLSFKDGQELTDLIQKADTTSDYGQDLLDFGLLLELLVLVNRSFQQAFVRTQTDTYIVSKQSVSRAYSKQLTQIITYLEEHLTEDISLKLLSGQFYLSESYLCRIFKQEAGTTIHKYITARRITLAKDLLSQGYSVTDACTLSGFKDYNGFLKSFVASVGIPPKKYAQFLK